ncbi:hypothetical protein CORC01_10121, partial [Colletotrichum orchidophilum]
AAQRSTFLGGCSSLLRLTSPQARLIAQTARHPAWRHLLLLVPANRIARRQIRAGTVSTLECPGSILCPLPLRVSSILALTVAVAVVSLPGGRDEIRHASKHHETKPGHTHHPIVGLSPLVGVSGIVGAGDAIALLDMHGSNSARTNRNVSSIRYLAGMYRAASVTTTTHKCPRPILLRRFQPWPASASPSHPNPDVFTMCARLRQSLVQTKSVLIFFT